MALIFRGSKFSRIALQEHLVEKISRIHGKVPRPHNGCGVLHLKTRPLRRCVVFCDSLSHFDVLRVRFQIPGRTFAAPDRAGGFSSGRYRTWWHLSHGCSAYNNFRHLVCATVCGPGSLHFGYCPFSLLKYTNRAINARVCLNTVHIAVGARHVSKFSLK